MRAYVHGAASLLQFGVGLRFLSIVWCHEPEVDVPREEPHVGVVFQQVQYSLLGCVEGRQVRSDHGEISDSARHHVQVELVRGADGYVRLVQLPRQLLPPLWSCGVLCETLFTVF